MLHVALVHQSKAETGFELGRSICGIIKLDISGVFVSLLKQVCHSVTMCWEFNTKC